jgi:predicted transcriptional regulator of viral defense system
VCWLGRAARYPQDGQFTSRALARLLDPRLVDPVRALVAVGGFARRATLRDISRTELSRALTSGRIIRVGRGFYGLGLPRGADALAAGAARTGGVVSHDSAAVLWHLEMAHVPGQHLTVPRNRSRVAVEGIEIHRADLEAGEIQQRAVVAVTSVLRTVLDCARTLPIRYAVVIADSALRNGLVRYEELLAACRAATGRGAERVRRVGELADPNSASVLESLLRVLLAENGLRPPMSQYPVYDSQGRIIARADFAWPRERLIVEVDGFEFHSSRADYRKDRRRWNAFTRMNWRVLRFSWEDVVEHPEYVVDAVRFELSKAA